MSGVPPDSEIGASVQRRTVTASSFRALQDKLRARTSISPPPVIPDLPITPAATAQIEPAPTPPPEPVAPAPEVELPAEPIAAAPEVEALPEPEAAPEIEATPEPVATATEVDVRPEPEAAAPEIEATPEPEVDALPEPEAAAPEVESTPEAVVAATEVDAAPEEDAALQPSEPVLEIIPEVAATEAVETEVLTDESVEPAVIEEQSAVPEPAAEALPHALEPVEQPDEIVELPLLSEEIPAPAGGKNDNILKPLTEKFLGTTTLLRKVDTETDPFSEAPSERPAAEEPIAELIDPQSGEVARSLLDVMSAPSGTSQPQERALAADTLLRLVPRLPLKNLMSLVERVSMMESPPQLLIRRLIRDPRIEIAGPLLERASAISDQDLMAVIAEGEPSKQRLIARRRIISPALADALIEAGDAGTLLTLVRNPGATFAIECFHRLGEIAAGMPALQAPLATRLDTPAPVAFELFWALPAELRRYILSRFLTDSETLNRVLKIALTVGNGEAQEATPPESKFADKGGIDEFVELATTKDRGAAAARLAELAGISQVNAERIIADREGEPITVVLKTLGLTRARFEEVIERIAKSPDTPLRGERNIAELQSIFDSLSFNKARMLLTYWDWASQHSGPYARGVK